jgi:hypothetical protein
MLAPGYSFRERETTLIPFRLDGLAGQSLFYLKHESTVMFRSDRAA